MKLSKKENKDWYNLVICLLALSCPSSKDELNLQVMKVNLSWSYIRDKQAHYAIKMVKIWAHIFGGYKLWKTFWSLCCKIYGKLVKEIGLTKVPTNCASQHVSVFILGWSSFLFIFSVRLHAKSDFVTLCTPDQSVSTETYNWTRSIIINY